MSGLAIFFGLVLFGTAAALAQLADRRWPAPPMFANDVQRRCYRCMSISWFGVILALIISRRLVAPAAMLIADGLVWVLLAGLTWLFARAYHCARRENAR